ncbi:MAG: phasin family protein [Phycisphaerae bacterium]|jgi:polyhydroxyalkanoate synthesis regulator phasin
MFESIDKLLLAGLGAMSMTRERAEEIFEEYVQRGQAERSGKAGFVKELVDSAERARKDFEKVVSEQLRAALDKMDLPSRSDLARIEVKLDQLLYQER